MNNLIKKIITHLFRVIYSLNILGKKISRVHSSRVRHLKQETVPYIQVSRSIVEIIRFQQIDATLTVE